MRVIHTHRLDGGSVYSREYGTCLYGKFNWSWESSGRYSSGGDTIKPNQIQNTIGLHSLYKTMAQSCQLVPTNLQSLLAELDHKSYLLLFLSLLLPSSFILLQGVKRTVNGVSIFVSIEFTT